jgi:ribosomal protein S18 acetylase RimI-like enzyme
MVYEEGCQTHAKPNREALIETVDERTIDTFNRIRTGAFGTPPAIASAFAEVYTRTVSRKAITHYVAYVSGERVGTTTLISAKGVGGIFNVGTLEGYRRRGIATSLMLRAIADSKAKGNHTLFLSVIKDGGAERLYENLGFRRLFVQVSYHLFRRR